MLRTARDYADEVAAPSLRDILTSLLEQAQTWVPDTDRAVVSQGLPVPECSVLGVWCERMDAGPSSVAKSGCHVEPRAWLHVSYWACAAGPKRDGSAPDAEDITDNALDFADVGEAIWSGIIAAVTGGTLIEGLTCSSTDLSQGMRVLTPQGGMAGWDATIIVSLT